MEAVQGAVSPSEELHSDDVFDLQFHPHDASVLASCSQDNTARIWRNNGSGQNLAAVLRGHQDTPLRLAFSPDGSIVAAGAANGLIKAWQAGSVLGDENPLPISRACGLLGCGVDLIHHLVHPTLPYQPQCAIG